MNIKYRERVSLSVSAIGPGPLSYKWKKDGNDIDDLDCTGINEQTLIVRSFSLKHEGNYMCEVKHSENLINSKSAKLGLSK